MGNSEYVGENLRLARGNTPKSDVAKACGITVSAYANYESGLRVPRDEVKLRLAEYFGMTVQALFFTPQHHI